MLVGQDPGYVRQQAGAVQGLYLDRYQEDARVAWGPVNGDHAFALGIGQVFQVDAVATVDGDAVAVGDEPLDLVAGDGGTALRQADPYIGDALHLDARVARGAGPGDLRDLGRDRGDLGEVLLGADHAADRANQAGDDRLGADPALAHRGVQAGEVGVAKVGGDALEGLGGHQALQRETLLAHDLGDLVLARFDRGLAALLGEPLADLVAGTGGLDEVQPVPVRARLGGLGGEDLHRVAVVQGGL